MTQNRLSSNTRSCFDSSAKLRVQAGNGYAQAEMTYVNPPFGADIVYRLGSAASGNVRLVISDVAGDTLANLTGPGGAGVHHVNWNFQAARPRTAEPVDVDEIGPEPDDRSGGHAGVRHRSART